MGSGWRPRRHTGERHAARPTPSADVARVSLHSLLVFAPDLAAARSFYTQAFGLRTLNETDSHVELDGDAFRLIIFQCESDSAADGYSSRAGSSIAFRVADLEAEAERLSQLGATLLHTEPATGPVGRYVAFTDPFGTVHELVEAG